MLKPIEFCFISSGKITYYTAPPEEKSESAHHVGAKIVSNWSKEFNLDDLLNDEQIMMDGEIVCLIHVNTFLFPWTFHK